MLYKKLDFDYHFFKLVCTLEEKRSESILNYILFISIYFTFVWKNDKCIFVGLIEPEHLNPTLFGDYD